MRHNTMLLNANGKLRRPNDINQAPALTNPGRNAAMSDAPTTTVPAEPEWIAWGAGWRLKGTNWTVRPTGRPPGRPQWWVVECGQKYFDHCPTLNAAKSQVIYVRCLMAEEPTP